jgi:hypothetical protein
MNGYLGGDVPYGHPDYNPFSATTYLLTVDDACFIADANQLLCDLVGWERGKFGDPKDPKCKTQTLIGKPLDVLVPPIFREAHHHFQRAFQENPTPRTMGEGRNTPVWVKDPALHVNGIHSIKGRQLTVLIGLSAIDEHYTLAIIQPLEVSRRFVIPSYA